MHSLPKRLILGEGLFPKENFPCWALKQSVVVITIQVLKRYENLGCTQRKTRYRGVLGGRVRAERCIPLSHSPKLRKVMPFLTCEPTCSRATVKVLLCPVERKHETRERMFRNKELEFYPRQWLYVGLSTFGNYKTDKASIF